MDKPPRITEESQIGDLSVDELRQVIEFYTESEKEDLIRPLMLSNEALKRRIAENEVKIRNEQSINNIFLRKMWKVLREDEKQEGASFFKEICEKINKKNRRC